MVHITPRTQEKDETQVCQWSAHAMWRAGTRQPSQLRGIVMRTQSSNPATPRLTPVRDEEAQREIQSFLQALRTYPDRFAREPTLSFAQHFSQVAAELPEVSGKAASV